MSDVKKILEDRATTHGNFVAGTYIMQNLKLVAHAAPKWNDLPWFMREAIDMILHKIGRILNGNPRHVDHWDDIAGYATLVSKELK